MKENVNLKSLEFTLDPESFEVAKKEFEDWCIDEAKTRDYDDDISPDWDEDREDDEIKTFLDKKY